MSAPGLVTCYEKLASGRCVAFACAAPGYDAESQDAFAVIPLGSAAAVLVIADGAGGYAQGAEASATLVDELRRELACYDGEAELREPILRGIDTVNERLREKRVTSATTAIVVEISENRFRHYLVGDSSVFLVGQRGRLRFQSVPQSLVGYGVEAGFIDQEQAMTHDEKHVVLNLVGLDDMAVEIGSYQDINRFDTLLLCSDGLTDNVPVDEIIAIVRAGNIECAMENLASLAVENMRAEQGHPDDLTILLFRRSGAGG